MITAVLCYKLQHRRGADVLHILQLIVQPKYLALHSLGSICIVVAIQLKVIRVWFQPVIGYAAFIPDIWSCFACDIRLQGKAATECPNR